MRRDIDRLTSRTFDLLVVGGGIYGLTVACDAAQRGLSVAVIDAGDFGGGSSFNHLRTIHGGLRYLQTLDLARARESVRERRAWARVAPHLVRPQPFVLPLYPSLTRSPLAMRAGFLVERVIASGRNAGIPPGLHLPPGRVVGAGEAARLLPYVPRERPSGAAIWHDYITPEADRLTFAWAIAAAEQGAVLANYVEARRLLVEHGRTVGVTATDGAGGREISISAAITVNATGGHVDRLLTGVDAAVGMPVLQAMNLVTRRPAGSMACGGRSASGRNFFLVPWRGRALFGTWEVSPRSAAGPPGLHAVSGFLAELNEAFTGLDLELEDVTLVHHGIVPAVRLPSGRLALATREIVRDHDRAGGPSGLLSVAGTKYTTARAVAERVTDLVFGKLKRAPVPCRTAVAPLPGAERTPPPGVLPVLGAAYGARADRVQKLLEDRPDLAAVVTEGSPVVAAQIVHAVREEMAITLCDAVLRRTPLGALGYPGDGGAERAAALMAGELNWTAEATRRELRALRQFYALA